MNAKIDHKKILPDYRAKPKTFELIEVPERHYLMIDGQGDPNTSDEYLHAVQSLFQLAYKLKFLSKQELQRDYVVMPLEGLWWAEQMSWFTQHRDKSLWQWTMMMMVPEWISLTIFERVLEEVQPKNSSQAVGKIRFESLTEGLCVQTLHLGSYDTETQTLERMHQEFIPAQELEMTGKHHEIYLSDPRRVAPEKLRTILRQPVRFRTT